MFLPPPYSNLVSNGHVIQVIYLLIYSLIALLTDTYKSFSVKQGWKNLGSLTKMFRFWVFKGFLKVFWFTVQ